MKYIIKLAEIQLAGSGGWVNADLTDEQVTKSKLVPNIDKHFLASLEKLDTTKMKKHFCKQCDSEFEGPTKIQIEESPNEKVADGLTLIERGQYTCHQCNSIIGEYRVFQKS
jgi:predicted aldo/keto reductase-like oxidoreductase